MKPTITRKAILIESPSKGDRFLPGVEQDTSNMRRLLQSDKCGRWYDNEILTLKNPTSYQVVNAVHSTQVDYLIIYLSGHGGTSKGRRRMFELKDGLFAIKDLWNKCPRQFIISDACSDFIHPGISGLPDYGEEYSNFDGYYPARELFDKYIANSPHGRILVCSSQIGYPSYDSTEGGYFTNALVHYATNLTTSQDYYPLSISEILKFIPQHLKSQNKSQIPVIYSKGNLNVPFAFGFTKDSKEIVKPYNPKQIPAVENANNEGFLLLGLGVLLLALAGGSN